MKDSKRIILAALIAVIIGCYFIVNKPAPEKHKFEGFTQVTFGKSSNLYIDESSISSDSETLTFNLIREIEDGYVLQRAVTNCKDRFMANTGVLYDAEGSALNEYPGDKSRIDFRKEVNLSLVVKKACEKSKIIAKTIQEQNLEQQRLFNELEAADSAAEAAHKAAIETFNSAEHYQAESAQINDLCKHKQTNPIDILVCSDDELRRLHNNLNAAVQNGNMSPTKYKTWLANRTKKCGWSPFTNLDEAESGRLIRCLQVYYRKAA